MIETGSPLPQLLANNLVVRYGEQDVLQGLNLKVLPGEIYALLGGNGAGKSTTISCFLGFLHPSSGELLVAGHNPVLDAECARAEIGYLPENVALYEHLTAFENVDYFLGLAGNKRSEPDIIEAFHKTGLQRKAWYQRVSGFSKGMRQKTAIAIALLRQVPILLLDEPTSGLDPSGTSDFNKLISSLRDNGTAILMVTHDLLCAAKIADRIGFLESGRIAHESEAVGPERFDVRDLYHHFDHPTHRKTAA